MYVKWVTHNTLNLQYLVKDCYWLQSTHKDTFAFHKGTFTLPKKSYFSFTIWLTTFVFLLQVRIKLKICRATQLFSPCSRSLLCKTFLEVVLPTVRRSKNMGVKVLESQRSWSSLTPFPQRKVINHNHNPYNWFLATQKIWLWRIWHLSFEGSLKRNKITISFVSLLEVNDKGA